MTARRRSTTSTAPAPETQSLEQPLHLKYRPRTLDEVVGQDLAVNSLVSMVESKDPNHAYMFIGPAGTGKTTLARILARAFGVEPNSITEIDAASSGGKDDVTALTQGLAYKGFGKTPNRAVILDECHALSKQAWDALLKTVEEPPDHVFLFFCTTVPGKVPETIMSRCAAYTLRALKYDDLMDILEDVADRERMSTPSSILQIVARAANGSARTALTMLARVRDCKDDQEAADLLESVQDSKEIIDLCRLLIGRDLTWDRLVSTVKSIPDLNPESVRIVTVNYLAACLMGAKSEKDTCRLLDILEVFSEPWLPSDKNAPLLRAFGKVIYPA